MGVRQKYINYIGHFIRSRVHGMVTDHQWREYLMENLPKDPSKATDKQLKNVAMTLYFSHFASFTGCANFWSLVTNYEWKTIRDFILDIQKVKRKYEMPESIVVFYTDENEVVKHMGKNNGTMDSIIKAMEKPIKERVTRSGVKKTSYATDSVKSKASKKYSYRLGPSGMCIYEVNGSRVKKTEVPAGVIKECDRYAKKIKAERDGTAKGTVDDGDSDDDDVIPVRKGKRSCKELKVTQLKEIAKVKGIKNYSKMKKQELCDVLGYE